MIYLLKKGSDLIQLIVSFRVILKTLISSDKKTEAGVKLFGIFRGLPKNKSLIKFLSEDGMKTLLQKTENKYLQDQGKEMHIIGLEKYQLLNIV